MTTLPDAAVIEIIERTNEPDPAVIVPNVHEIAVDASDFVQVTLTLFAKRVTMQHEPREDA